MGNHYRVMWEIDTEEEGGVLEAVEKAMYYMEKYKHTSVYSVKNMKTGAVYEVDMEPEVPEVTDVTNQVKNNVNQ